MARATWRVGQTKVASVSEPPAAVWYEPAERGDRILGHDRRPLAGDEAVRVGEVARVVGGGRGEHEERPLVLVVAEEGGDLVERA